MHHHHPKSHQVRTVPPPAAGFRAIAAALLLLAFPLPSLPVHAETRILFSSDKVNGSNQHWELYTMREDGSDLQRINVLVQALSKWAPALAPDNHTIAFVDNRNIGENNLWTTSLEGGLPSRIPITNRALAVQWADEDTIYYLAQLSGAPSPLQRFQIWQVDLDGSNERAVYQSTFDIFPTGSDSFQYHPGLDRFYWTARIPFNSPSVPYSGLPTGTTFDIEFAPCNDFDFPPRGPELDDHYDVAVSPDGTTMAYAADFFDGSHRMYVRSANGDCSSQLRLSSGFTGDPHWSPDSQWIAFTQSPFSTFGRDPYIGNIHTAHKDGSTLVNLTGSQESVSSRCAHPLVYRTGPEPQPFSFLSVTGEADGAVRLSWEAIDGLLYQVEYSNDLVTWFSDLPDSSILAGSEATSLDYTDSGAKGDPRRYYRVTSSSP